MPDALCLAATAKTEKAKSAAVVLPAGASLEVVQALVGSVMAGLYHDVRFKSVKPGEPYADVC